MTVRSDPGERSFVRVHAWVVVLVTLLAVGAALAVALREPVSFTAESRIEALPLMTGGAPLPPDMGTEREVLRSGTVARDAAGRLDTSIDAALSHLDVSVVTDTRVLVVKYTASTPGRAFDGADAFTTYYVSDRNAGQAKPVAQVITTATVPERGQGANLALILAVALLGGLVLGVGAAWAWDRATDRVRSTAELERTGWPVLVTDLSAPVHPLKPVVIRRAADFSLLAARLMPLLHGRREGIKILVVSPVRRSGSSTIAANTAAALVSSGRRVVLVDADLATPGTSSLAPGALVPGYAEVLDGRSSPEAALQTVEPQGLRLLPSSPYAGLLPSSPYAATPGLDVDMLSLMLGQLASRHIVVVDGPAVLDSPDALVLASQVDVVLLVADLGRLCRRDVTATMRLFGDLEVPVAWVSHTWKPAYSPKRDQAAVSTQPQSADQAIGTT